MSTSLLGFLQGTKNIQLGIDVGSAAVKIVALESNANGTQLLGMGWEESPPGAVVDGSINDTRSIAQVVKSALEQTNIRYKGCHASVGLRGINVVFKHLSIPFQGFAELPKQIILEAQQHIDSDLEQWQIDYETIGAPGSDGQILVLLVAAKKAVVDQYLELLKQVGVKPSVVDCDTFAISNSFEFSGQHQDKTTLCVDVGRDSTKIHLLSDGNSRIIRSLSLGGSHFTDLLARQLNVNHNEAEAIKWNAALPEFAEAHPNVVAVCHQHTEELLDEIKKTMDFYSGYDGQTSIRAIDSVVLSGGGSVVPGLSAGISALLSADTHFASPFNGMKISKRVSESVITRYSHQFAVAAGLALRRTGDKA